MLLRCLPGPAHDDVGPLQDLAVLRPLAGKPVCDANSSTVLAWSQPGFIHRAQLAFVLNRTTRKPVVLGAGVSGMVLEARYQGQRVAVKVYKDTSSDAAQTQQVLHEVVHLRQLRAHVNVVAMLGFTAVELEPETYRWAAVMELLPDTLDALLHRTTPAPALRERLTWAAHVLAGVAHLHANDLIHSDIKSSNVLVAADGTAKLCDFGLSHARPEGEVITPGSARWHSLKSQGTPMYMDPQVAHRACVLSKASDVFSAGVLLWELVTGRVPYAELGNIAVPEFQRRVQAGLRPENDAAALAALEPAGIGALIASMWHADGAARPAIDECRTQIGRAHV